MPLPLTVSNGVKVYSLSVQSARPEWSAAKKPNNNDDDSKHLSKVDLIQDFTFPASCKKIKVSADAKYLVATGVYKPRVKVFDLDQLSLKFERFIDSEVCDFLTLSEDISKMVFLRSDRVLEFHSRFGAHFRTKIPKYGRSMIYNPYNCDLLVTSSCNSVYRMNLEEGRFKAPYETDLDGSNDGFFHERFNFYAFGGENGKVQCFDPRTKNAVSTLDITEGLFSVDPDERESVVVTKLARPTHPNGDQLKMAVGTQLGKVLLYDLRMARPLMLKDHRNEQPVTDMTFHTSGLLATADKSAIKIWDTEKNRIFTSIIPADSGPINSFSFYKNSGVVFAACDSQKVQSFFVPQLGEAPKWCSFLDNITEELEEQKHRTVYEDFKFVTKDELKQLGSLNLIGTDALKPYMHGYFMNYRNYAKVKATVSREELEEYLRVNRKAKIEARLSEKINSARKLSKPRDKKKSRKAEERTVEDERFSRMFDDEDFNIDVRSEEFRLRYSAMVKKKLKGSKEEEK